MMVMLVVVMVMAMVFQRFFASERPFSVTEPLPRAGPEPGLLHTLLHFIFTAALGGGCNNYSHFTDEQSKA